MDRNIEEAQKGRHEAIDANRALGVVDYKSGEKQSDRVYEVTEGYKHLPGGIKLGPGQRFRPTERQIKGDSLKGKARELTQTEYGSVRRQDRRPVSTGADFDAMEREAKLRELPMADSTLDIALRAKMSGEDFEGVEPGHEGRYTRAQVEDLISAKSGESADA